MVENNNFDYKKYWEKEVGIFQKIYKIGLEQYVQFSVPSLYWAFSSIYMSVGCMDEGITDGKLRIGGSGIFEFSTLEEVAKLLLAVNIDLVTTHEECGGARLAYAQRNNVAAESIPNDVVDQFAMEWGIGLTRRLNELVKQQGKYKEIFHRHIKVNELGRPKGFHPARMLYLNTTKQPFNPSRVIGLPSGYVISRGNLTAKQSEHFASRAIAISFSNIGFQNWITENNPFIVAVIIDKNDKNFSLSIIKEEIRQVLKPYGKRIIVDGFTTNWLTL